MKEWNKKELKLNLEQNKRNIIYLYTPLCGTCQVAKKMLSVVNELLPTTDIGICDLNYIPEFAREWEIESVPCLLITENDIVKEKIYAFQSVEYLYNKLK